MTPLYHYANLRARAQAVRPRAHPLLSAQADVLLFGPLAWQRSLFGKPYAKVRPLSLARLLSSFWAPNLPPFALKVDNFYKTITSITLSRGPMARKKQSREQFSAATRGCSFKVQPVAKATFLGLYDSTPLAVLLRLSLKVINPLRLFESNLFAFRSTTRCLEVASWRTFLLP